MMKFDVPDARLGGLMHPDVKRYSAWVYDSEEMLLVYEEEMPNTNEIWMEFHEFTYLYWEMMTSDCVDECEQGKFYNYSKIKMFMIRYMLSRTNCPGVFIEKGRDGALTDDSFEKVMRIHPRIWRVIFDKVNVFPVKDAEKDREFEKQCYALFGKGQSVQNPHEDIIMYNSLVSFWDKFGLNYFDVMRLPQSLYDSLMRVLKQDNAYQRESLKNKDK